MFKIYFNILFLSLIIFSCKTIQTSEENASKKNIEEQKKQSIIENKKETDFNFEFIDFEYSYSENESIQKDNNFYSVIYNLNFKFKTNKNFTYEYQIFDNNNNLVYSKKNIKVSPNILNPDVQTETDEFSDNFSYSTLKCKITVFNNQKTYNFESEFQNPLMPVIDYLTFGPVITKYENQKNVLSILVDLSIKNCSDLLWIRLIPPSQNYYWFLNSKKEGSKIISNSTITDNKNKNYLENGKYLIQINLGKSGVIQKEIILTDLFDNKTNFNYGLPVANEINSDKDVINLDIQFLEKIDYMEIWIYSNEKNNYIKLGVAKITKPVTQLQKKELINQFFNESNKKIELKNNKKYFYKIYLYSKEHNGINYISTSNFIQLVFQGFKFLFF